MKTICLLALCFSLTATAALAEVSRALPVTTSETSRVSIRGVTAERQGDVIRVSGWVRRNPSSYSPIAAHLHIEALNIDGQSIELVEAQWQGPLHSSVRQRHRSAPFGATLASGAAASSVRVTVVPGRQHRT